MTVMTARTRTAATPRVLRWRLEVLGGACFVTDNGARLRLERKTAGVLCFLALEGEVTRSKVAGLLWSDSDEERARGNLRQCLHRLKKLVGVDLVRGADRLSLEPDVEVDALTLESRSFLGDDAGLITVRGELLEGFDFEDCEEFADWLSLQRERWRSLRAGAYRRGLRDPQAGDAVTWAREWMALEPLSEEAQRALALALEAQGNRAQALRGLFEFEALLQTELRAAPSAQTRSLREQLERDSAPLPATPKIEVVPSALSRPAHLFGREREWRAMERAWRDSKAIIVSGAPGVGKTRLIEDFLTAHGGGTRFEGRPGDALQPYSTHARTYRQVLETFKPVLEASVRAELARIVPELGVAAPPMTSDTDKLRFVQAKASATRQAVALGMRAIIVDDLQFVDDASLEAGYQVYSEHWGHVDGMRTIIAYREGELSAPGVAMLERAVSANLAVHVRLEPLSDEAMRALLDSLPITEEVKGRSLEFARGNPLYALEVAREGALEARVPERIADLTRERLRRLSLEAQRVAQVAAVAGTAFTLEVAGRVLDTSPFALADALTELETAQVMRGERFHHDLVFEAVLDGISPGVRRFLHRRVAQALEGSFEASRVAHHWLEGGEESRAAPWLLRAATEARTRYRLAEAAEFAERAAHALERAGEERAAFDAFEAAALDRVDFDLGNRLEAVVDALFRLSKDDAGRARAWRARVRMLNAWQFAPQAEDAARQGLNIAEPSSLTRADLGSGLAESLWRQEQHAPAVAALEDALSIYRALGETQRLAQAEGRLGIIHGDSEDHASAQMHLQQSVALLEGLGDEFGAAKSRNMLGITLGRIGLIREALTHHRLVADTCARIQGADVLQRMNLANIAQRLFDLDRYSEALQVTRDALGMVQPELTWAQAYSHTQLARLWLRLGALEDARTLLEEVLSLPNLREDMRFDALLLRAALHTELGEATQARALLDPLLEVSARPFRRIELALSRAKVQDPPDALETSRAALILARKHGLNGLVVAALTRVAQAALRLEDHRTAREHTTEACALLEQFDPPNFYRAETWWTHARALQASGLEAQVVREQAKRWVLETANERVPPEHRTAFLESNAANRAILEHDR
jgi:DNA-binding SARP family transcriptional activator